MQSRIPTSYRAAVVGFPAVIAGLSLVAAYSGGIYSIQATSVANAMLLFATAPFMAAVLGWMVLREPVRTATWAARLCTFQPRLHVASEMAQRRIRSASAVPLRWNRELRRCSQQTIRIVASLQSRQFLAGVAEGANDAIRFVDWHDVQMVSAICKGLGPVEELLRADLHLAQIRPDRLVSGLSTAERGPPQAGSTGAVVKLEIGLGTQKRAVGWSDLDKESKPSCGAAS